MLRLTLAAALFGFAGAGTADEPKPAESKLKPFHGVWATTRERKDGDKVVRSRLVLEFKGDTLTFFTERDGKKDNSFTLTVGEPETNRGDGRVAEADRLILTGSSAKYAVYYE